MDISLLPQWLQQIMMIQQGELPGERLARILEAFNGCSLSNNPDKLAWLFSVNELDYVDGKRVSAIQTSCATTMRSCIAAAGSKDPLAIQPYVIGQAISDVLQIARNAGALIDCRNNPDAWQMLDRGWIIYYNVNGGFDHVEMCLERPNPISATCKHGGGGRPASLISIETSDIRHSMGRSIWYIIDPNKLNLPFIPAPIIIQPQPAPPPVDNNTLPVDNTTTTNAIVVGSAQVPIKQSFLQAIWSFVLDVLKKLPMYSSVFFKK